MSGMERPIGETLDGGRFRIVACIVGDMLRGVFRAQSRTETALVTLAPRQQRTIDLALRSPRIAELLHIGPLSTHGLDGMVEAEPAGTPLGERRLALGDALAIVRDASSIVDEAHRRGLVLRGMRPELVYVAGTRVTGIAPRCEPFLATSTPSSQGVVHPFDHFYLAPELLQLREPSRAADVFSLGAMLAMLVTGEHPFTGDLPPQQLVSISRGERRPWHGPDELRAIVDRALHSDPSARPTAAELAGALGS
jgi:serine/threonine protein kinase